MGPHPTVVVRELFLLSRILPSGQMFDGVVMSFYPIDGFRAVAVAVAVVVVVVVVAGAVLRGTWHVLRL